MRENYADTMDGSLNNENLMSDQHAGRTVMTACVIIEMYEKRTQNTVSGRFTPIASKLFAKKAPQEG